jgi:hypothetical protein
MEENEDIDNIIEKIKRSVSIDDDKIQKIVISRYFKNEFEGQINYVNKPSTTGTVLLTIKGKNIEVIIEDNECNKFTDDVGICHSAIYMDTPFVIDDSSMLRRLNYPPFLFSPPINHRKNILYRLDKEHSDNTAIEAAIINQKTTNILATIHSVANGTFKEDKERLMFMESGLEKPIPLSRACSHYLNFI